MGGCGLAGSKPAQRAGFEVVRSKGSNRRFRRWTQIQEGWISTPKASCLIAKGCEAWRATLVDDALNTNAGPLGRFHFPRKDVTIMSSSRPNPPRRNWFAVWRWPLRKQIKWTVLLALVSLLTTYQAAYYGLLKGVVVEKCVLVERFVDDTLVVDFGQREVKTLGLNRYPSYRFEGKLSRTSYRTAESFFEPAHQIDRYFRPAKWNSPDPLRSGEEPKGSRGESGTDELLTRRRPNGEQVTTPSHSIQTWRYIER